MHAPQKKAVTVDQAPQERAVKIDTGTTRNEKAVTIDVCTSGKRNDN